MIQKRKNDCQRDKLFRFLRLSRSDFRRKDKLRPFVTKIELILFMPRATARVPTHPLNHPRPYNERTWGADSVVIVRAGVVWMLGGDPCGRPRTKKC